MRFDRGDLGLIKGRNNNNNRGNYNNRNDNRGNRNDNRNNNNRGNNNRIAPERSDAFLKSGLGEFERGFGNREFDEDINFVADDVITTSDVDIDEAAKTLDLFLNDYADILLEKGNQVPVIIRDLFWDVANIFTHYYENKYSALQGQFNKVLNIMSTHRFATSLALVLNNDKIDNWSDGVSPVWRDVMFILSTVLITSHGHMKEETITLYIDLISSNGLAGADINRLVKDLGISKDLAIDLSTSIPVLPDDMTDATLKEFYNSFVMRLMDHAEDNIDVLDRTVQSKLFSFFFGKNKNALKALGRMMAHPVITTFKNSAQEIIYAEYLSMLSERLDAYEIKDIKYVLKFIADSKKRPSANGQTVSDKTTVVFGKVSIADFDSIRKALFELIKEVPGIDKFLITV